MFSNYLKIAIRNLLKHKIYSFINILGLALGISCCVLILLYVQDELSFDRFHEKADRIYRVAVDTKIGGDVFQNALTGAPVALALLKDYPEIVSAVRFHPYGRVLVSNGDKRFYEERFKFADASVFEVFTFPLIKGDPATALIEPNTIVLTEDMARKYFGAEDPMGKILRIDQERDYIVTGVMTNVPENSHIRFDFLASFKTLESIAGDRLNIWTYNPFFTYVLLPHGYPPRELDKKIAPLYEKAIGDGLKSMGWELRPILQPLMGIHLHPSMNDSAGGDILQIYILLTIALVILLIACINFTNLSTARSETRAREVGMRKVAGARRGQLISQFLGESILMAFLAMLVGILFVEILLPHMNAITGREMKIDYFKNLIPRSGTGGLLGLTLFVGIVAGGYPAFFLASIKPAIIVKGKSVPGGMNFFSRKVLVVFQFCISAILIIVTFGVYRQLDYLRNKNLGFKQEQVVVVPVRDRNLIKRRETYKNMLLQNASVRNVTFASRYPGTGTSGTAVHRTEETGAPPFEMKYLLTDYDFIETLDIQMAAGRSFSRRTDTDSSGGIILNESAVRAFGWKTPEEVIGKTISYSATGTKATIIGVVRDFHFLPLKHRVQPLMMALSSGGYQYMMLRLSTQDIAGTLDYLRERWTEFVPAWPFEYFFLDENFNKHYHREQRFGRVFGVFSLLAILIGCLGLFGLASFTAGQRTREIGIRKVLGATAPRIVHLLSREFLRLVIIANVIALPLGYYIIDTWLQGFAYRTGIGYEIFLLASAITFIIALGTVSAQAIKSARANPVEALRYE